MENYYPKNMNVVHFDDDITQLKILKNKKELIPLYDLDKLIKYGFNLINKYNTPLLGFSPVNNPFFMENTIAIGLYFCIGNFYLHKNTKEIKLKYPDFTDYELSLKTYLKHGKILRLNNSVAVTNYASTNGGTTEYRTKNMQKKIVQDLIERYPKFVQQNPKKDNPYQIRFKTQKNNKKEKI